MLLIPASGAAVLNFSPLDSLSSLSDVGGTERVAPPAASVQTSAFKTVPADVHPL